MKQNALIPPTAAAPRETIRQSFANAKPHVTTAS
jgi:hypothetical protein